MTPAFTDPHSDLLYTGYGLYRISILMFTDSMVSLSLPAEKISGEGVNSYARVDCRFVVKMTVSIIATAVIMASARAAE